MFYIHCLFDQRRSVPRPLYAVSCNKATRDIEFYQLYMPGTKTSLEVINSNLERFKSLILKEEVVLSNFNTYIAAFKLDLDRQYEVYDLGLELKSIPDTVENAQKALLKHLTLMLKSEILPWQQILANSQLAYTHLEKVGFYLNGKKSYPQYEFTYSGRSRCLRSNIHSANDSDVIHHVDENNNVYVHFDWIAADFRIASLISNDKYLKESFKKSDPYSALHEALKDTGITRDQCKLGLFRSLYSMSHDSDLLNFYPDFAKWMQKSESEIEQQGLSKSLLGRPFLIGEDRSIRSVFNAQIQGSVAHAMQNILYRVYKIYPDNLLTEIHDALIMCCSQDHVKVIIDEVANLMLYPFDGIMDTNPKFPLKISIGYEWKKWQPFKEIR